MARKKVNLGQMEFHATDYPGVVYILSSKRMPDGKPEKIYYVRYRDPKGRQRFERAGRQSRKMTPAKASDIRWDRSHGKELPNKERREAKDAAKLAEQGRWTFDKLWTEWMKVNPHKKGKVNDDNRYRTHLKEPFGDREPSQVLPLEVERLKARLLKAPDARAGRKFEPGAKRRADYSAEKRKELAERAAKRERKTYAIGTVKSILGLLTRIANFGAKRQLCEGLRFKIEGPKGAKQKTEDMTAEQMAAYIKTCREWPDPQAGNFQLLALYTGMRRGELRNLKWSDVDSERGFLLLRDPKGGEDQRIPMSSSAQALLEGHPKIGDDPYVFAGEEGGARGIRQIASSSRAIRKAAGLPDDFRPNHGLRHTFASHLASSGEVDLYTLQKLMTHKSPTMTQRYAHLTDAALKRGADVMSRIVTEAGKTTEGAG